MQLLALLIKALPTILSLVQRFVSWADARKLIEQGEMQAIARETKALLGVVAIAREAERVAEDRHRADPTDDAFDPDFFRKE
jgi:hypothetical protein